MTEPTSPTDEQTRDEWTLGTYSKLAQEFLPMAAELVDAAGVDPGAHVLDVACGTGNVALTAARRGASVTGADITPAMLDQARERTALLETDVQWREGDATALPFDDDTFDVTLSCLGHMFAHDPTMAATEIVRVTRPGAQIAFTAWTPDGGIAAMMQALSSYLPTPPNGPPPFLWGDPPTVQERFGDRVAALTSETGSLEYRALSPAHFWAAMRADSGAIMLMYEEVDDRQLPALNESVIDALSPSFSAEKNAIELKYRLFTATVV